jgi:hypothetical protein
MRNETFSFRDDGVAAALVKQNPISTRKLKAPTPRVFVAVHAHTPNCISCLISIC